MLEVLVAIATSLGVLGGFFGFFLLLFFLFFFLLLSFSAALASVEVEVLLYVHRNHRLIRDRSQEQPPQLSHSS